VRSSSSQTSRVEWISSTKQFHSLQRSTSTVTGNLPSSKPIDPPSASAEWRRHERPGHKKFSGTFDRFQGAHQPAEREKHQPEADADPPRFLPRPSLDERKTMTPINTRTGATSAMLKAKI